MTPSTSYPPSTFETTSTNYYCSYTQNVFHLMGPSPREHMASHGQSGFVATVSQVESSMFFPFVCGVCSLKFNKILDFFAHFKVHNYPNFSEEFFHTCGYRADNKPDRSKQNVNFYTCGICAVPFPSLCLLHEHLVCVERAVSYTLNIRTRVAEKIVFAYNETSNQYNDAIAVESDEIAYLPTNTQESGHKKFASFHDANKYVPVLHENCITEINDDRGDILNHCHIKANKSIDHSNNRAIDHDFMTARSSTLTCDQRQQMSQTAIMNNGGATSEILTDSENMRVNTVKIVYEEISNDGIDEHIVNVTKDINNHFQEAIRTDSEQENQDTLWEENITVANVKDCDEDLQDTQTSYCKRTSERLKTHNNIDPSSNNVQVESGKAKQSSCKRRSAVGDEAEGDFMFVNRERKFGDSKRERRRLLMIRYQKSYRDRKRLKALGLWHPKSEAGRDSTVKGKTSKQETTSVNVLAADIKVPCDVCGLMFKKKNLKRHTETHAAVKAYQCDICFKTFKTHGYLYSHKMHHKTMKDLICDHCGKAFNNGPNLRQHLKIHVKERTHQCPMCPKKFRSSYVLKDHVQRHSDAKPHTCPECGRNFKIAQEVTRHMLVHSDERPHVCSICHKGFKTRSNLVKHEKIHSKEIQR